MGTNTLAGWFDHYPQVLAFIIVLLGWILAILLRRAARAGLPWLNRFSAGLGVQGSTLLSPKFARAVQAFVFWGALLTSVILAIHIMGSAEPTSWIDGVLQFISRLLIALAIMVAGHILGLLADSLLNGLSKSVDMGVLPRLSYIMIMTMAALTALAHLGLDVSFITQVVLILVTVFFAGIATAFAIGARSLVANLAAKGELRRFSPGDRISVGEVSGTVLEIHQTGVILKTESGAAHIPAAKFAEETIIELHTEQADG